MIKYTLIGDGSSDMCLMKIIDWTLEQCWPEISIFPQYAEFRHLGTPLKTLQKKIDKAIELYPCDVLFIHRDAEKVRQNEEVYEERCNEIEFAMQGIDVKYIPVIPIKMMETWLLTDISAIRKAAGNRNSTVTISLPPIVKLENESNPKELLYDCLKRASGLKGRRLTSFNERQAVHLVAEYTTDFSQLRNLFAFIKFEKDLKAVIEFLKKDNGTGTLSAGN